MCDSNTYISSILLFKSDNVGSELLSLTKAFSKSGGSVTFCNELRSGTGIFGDGAPGMMLNALSITVLAASMDPWMAERIPFAAAPTALLS